MHVVYIVYACVYACCLYCVYVCVCMLFTLCICVCMHVVYIVYACVNLCVCILCVCVCIACACVHVAYVFVYASVYIVYGGSRYNTTIFLIFFTFHLIRFGSLLQNLCLYFKLLLDLERRTKTQKFVFYIFFSISFKILRLKKRWT